MKKIMIMIAAASLLVACGGNSEKKTDSANEQKTESTDVQKEEKKELTVEEQTVAYCEKLAAAEDEAEAEKIVKEMEEWLQSLSEEDQMKAENAFYEFQSKQYGYDQTESSYGEEYTYEEDYYGYDEEDSDLSVKEQAWAYCEKIAAAETPEEMEKIMKEVEKWERGLSKEDLAKAEKAAQEWAEKKYSYDEEDFYVYDAEVYDSEEDYDI